MKLSGFEAGIIHARLGDVAKGPRFVASGVIRSEAEPDLVRLAEEFEVRLRVAPATEPACAIWWASRYEWALDALAWIESEGHVLGPHLHWIQGLLYGIEPAQIGEYLRREGGPS